MFERILLPTDFSRAAEQGLRIARAIALRFGSELHLAHVDEEHALGMHTSDDLIQFMNEVDVRRKDWMESLATDLEEAGVGVTLVRLDGIASEQILRYADEGGIDLIIMGTTGHTRLKHLLLGSTGRAVLRHARCPVISINSELFSAEGWDVERVLFPTDFSPASHEGLGVAVTVAKAFGAAIDLLHVLKVPTFIPAMPGEPPSYVSKQAYGAATSRAAGDLEALSERPELKGMDVRRHVMTAGDTADGIASYAAKQGCGLIVIPRHGFGRLRSILFGRVAQHVVKLAPVPVLSFRPAAVREARQRTGE